ncbi:MAG: hypothetical protein M1829_001658 [Trizodia sp. TS-e1964]|nr:MAG: hypothetical protein M1829_001658 [Trizodia sp. TS-e1964]
MAGIVAPVKPQIFTDKRFCIVISPGLAPQAIQKLVDLICEHGGTHVSTKASDSELPRDVHYIISETADFPCYLSLHELFISTVRPDYITESVASRRLLPPRSYSPDPRLIFAGVTVSIVDLSDGDRDAIISGVVALGGQYSDGLSKTLTHIVALTDNSQICRDAISKQLQVKIVSPLWFGDCLKLGSRVNEEHYTLPDPDISQLDPANSIDANPKRVLLLPMTRSPSFVGNATPAGVFRKRSILLSKSLEISDFLRNILEQLIVEREGTLAANITEANVVISRFRENDDFQQASRSHKEVGNVRWLFSLIFRDSWSSPLEQLLHYPLSKDKLPGFEQYRISLTNYDGPARLYLEYLVVATGAVFTRSMRQDNTHLLTANRSGMKCTAAEEWGISMVNHLWLEESYASWTIKDVKTPKYSNFLFGSRVSSPIGQTHVDLSAMQQLFFPSDTNPPESPDGSGTPNIETNSSLASSFVEETNLSNDAVKESLPDICSSPKKELKASNGHLSGSKSEAVNHSKMPSDTENTNMNTDELFEGLKFSSSISSVEAQLLNDQPISSRAATIKSVARSRSIHTGSDTKDVSSISTSSRSAKISAATRLHEVYAPDIALYEKEKRRTGGVVYGGRKSTDLILNAGSKRLLDELDSSADERETKKPKSTRPPPTMKLLITSYHRWSVDKSSKIVEVEKKRLRDLGILTVTKPSRCTHLAAPSILRTEKFLLAIAYAPIIISTTFIDECLASNELKNAKDYILKDSKGEKALKCKLEDSLARARKNQKTLFQGWTIYCTPKLLEESESYRTIVETNGGQLLVFRSRDRARVHDNTDDDETTEQYTSNGDVSEIYLMISDTEEHDIVLRRRFEKMVIEEGKRPLVVVHKWLVDSIITQQVMGSEQYLAS